ncbi:hypothetical protein EV356DRAFT_574732 [Viridothelium virens]|uniref:Uncharacterized protein n=1 Tax=Viridothelium virens TaxID=1048519 RepID=A0A6A6HG30_VIRVR|nr:hypothetical protein EV356DRAFT_574732 [Viridothelium virens]
MQSSRVLAFKALASKIHPQLPLNPRESQQLLNMLTSSFRQHLEKEHPHGASGDTKPTEYRPPMDCAQESPDARSGPSPQVSVGNVLESILSNPLLSTSRGRLSLNRTTASTESADVRLRRIINEPVEWFEDQNVQGTPSMEVARTYLTMVSKISDSPEKAQYKHRAAVALSGYLWATGSEDSLEFVCNDQFTSDTVHLLVSHGFEKKIWLWVHRLETLRCGDDLMDLTNKQMLLLVFLARARVAISNTAESALDILFHAMGRTTLNPDAAVRKALVAKLWKHLSKQMIKGTLEPKDPAVFDRFIQVASHLDNDLDLYRAQLMLRHPEIPDAEPAISYIRKRLKLGSHSTSFVKNATHMKLLLDTAQVLLSQAKYHDVAWVMSIAREYFSTELDPGAGPMPKSFTSQRESSPTTESMNLELLNGLSLG